MKQMNFVMACFIYGSLFFLLLFCAFRDWKEGIIPNRYLIRGIAIRIFLLLHEVWLSGPDSLLQWLSKAGISILILLSGILIRKMTRDGIGMGDIKLLAMMFLYLTAAEWYQALVFSLFVGLIMAIVTKMKSKEDRSIPFAPAVFAGMVLAVIL